MKKSSKFILRGIGHPGERIFVRSEILKCSKCGALFDNVGCDYKLKFCAICGGELASK